RDSAQLRGHARRRGAPGRDLPGQPRPLRARRAAAQRSPRVRALYVAITVLTYNVHSLHRWLVSDDPEARMPEISSRLNAYDVALVQESWTYWDALASRATHPVHERGNGPHPPA